MILTIIFSVFVYAAGIVTGALIYKKNPAKSDAVIEIAKKEAADAKVALDAEIAKHKS